MKYRILILCILFLTVIFVSCKKNRLDINVPDLKVTPEIVRFEEKLFSITPGELKTNVVKLRETYPEFFDLYTNEMIRIGNYDDSLFFGELNRFVTDTMIQNVKKLVEKEFSDFSKSEKDLKKAFRYYKYYFPEKPVPKIYTCISGFNQSIVIAENLVGISLDKYLGSDCPYYEMLGMAKYLRQKMEINRLPVDAMYGLATADFGKINNESNLLSFMIYEGKLLYFIDAMFPKMNDTLKIGYTAQQLGWCKKNEAQMWMNLIENKRLYATGRMDIKRMIDESPYTNGFPVESPGRTGIWLGWQIVRKYMTKHPEVTLPELMKMDDSQKILNDSKYYPG
jgi:gliding motility-associated lipoprotein GldB